MRSIMKWKVFLYFAIMLVTAAAIDAQEGYTGPSLSPVSVETARKLRDNSPVILRGKIKRFLGDEKYLFSDGSGTIIIEIDSRFWIGLSVNQTDIIEITGEIDRDFRDVEIEVSGIRKIKK